MALLGRRPGQIRSVIVAPHVRSCSSISTPAHRRSPFHCVCGVLPRRKRTTAVPALRSSAAPRMERRMKFVSKSVVKCDVPCLPPIPTIALSGLDTSLGARLLTVRHAHARLLRSSRSPRRSSARPCCRRTASHPHHDDCRCRAGRCRGRSSTACPWMKRHSSHPCRRRFDKSRSYLAASAGSRVRGASSSLQMRRLLQRHTSCNCVMQALGGTTGSATPKPASLRLRLLAAAALSRLGPPCRAVKPPTETRVCSAPVLQRG